MLAKKWFLILVLSFIFLPSFVLAQGAKLYIVPQGATYQVGQVFDVDVKVDTGGDFINAGDFSLKFDNNILKVRQIFTKDSIFNFWTPQPYFSNKKGTVNVSGGTLKPYSGSEGLIVKIEFQALKTGKSQLRFNSGAILASDGKGTNILAEMDSTFCIIEPKGVLTPTIKGLSINIPEGAPSLPVIYSLSHPDSESWYNKKDVKLSWDLPDDVTAVRILLDRNPFSLPLETYSPPIKTKEFNNLDEGIWYFHLRFKNKYGWGEIAHRKIMIDIEAPLQFSVNIDNNNDPTNPIPLLNFSTQDLLSGIAYYEISLGSSTFRVEKGEFIPKPLLPGSYTIVVKAFDKAGNFSVNLAQFKIEPLEPPVITELSSNILVGSPLVVKGETIYPHSKIFVFIERNGQKVEIGSTRADSSGHWLFAYEKGLKEGVYHIWAKVQDKRGAESLPTDKRTILVAYPTLIKVGKIAISYLSVILSLISLLIILVLVLFYGWYRIKRWQTKLSTQAKETYLKIIKAFDLLEKEVKHQIEYLDKKPGFSEEEELIYKRLKKVLDHTEKIIGKRIDELKREIEG